MEHQNQKPKPRIMSDWSQPTPLQHNRCAELQDDCKCCLTVTLCAPCYLWWVFGMGANKLK